MPSGHRPPIPPGYARVAYSGLIDTKPWVNVFYLQLTGASIVVADLNTLASDLATNWNTTIGTDLTNTASLTQVKIVYVPSVGNELVGVWVGSHAGQVATADTTDAATCYLLNWNISAYYRGGHPRWYLPGVAVANISSGGTVAGSLVTGLTTYANNHLTYINGVTTTNISAVVMGTMSFQSGNAWRGTPLFRPFKSGAVSNLIAHQRRRIGR